jgi:hypothetical protein
VIDIGKDTSNEIKEEDSALIDKIRRKKLPVCKYRDRTGTLSTHIGSITAHRAKQLLICLKIPRIFKKIV